MLGRAFDGLGGVSSTPPRPPKVRTARTPSSPGANWKSAPGELFGLPETILTDVGPEWLSSRQAVFAFSFCLSEVLSALPDEIFAEVHAQHTHRQVYRSSLCPADEAAERVPARAERQRGMMVVVEWAQTFMSRNLESKPFRDPLDGKVAKFLQLFFIVRPEVPANSLCQQPKLAFVTREFNTKMADKATWLHPNPRWVHKFTTTTMCSKWGKNHRSKPLMHRFGGLRQQELSMKKDINLKCEEIKQRF